MAKEIGGYMELERFTGREYYPDYFKINLGRTALVYLLQKLGCGRIFIPQYNCDSCIRSVRQAGFDAVTYAISEDLQPVLDPQEMDPQADWLYVVNHYGQLDSDDIRKLYETYHHRIILDNAQAFYQAPLPEAPCIYTARKFFGLSDGAYIYSPTSIASDLPEDRSAGRMKHILGRLEDGARSHYSDMLAVSDTFAEAEPRRMSALTENLLRAIDYEEIAARRCRNYETLSRLLPSENPFTRRTPIVPFAYPYYHPDGVKLRKALAEQNIFVPTNWTYLLSSMPEDSLEYQWSKTILPLPIDQRYGEEEMRQLAEAILAY